MTAGDPDWPGTLLIVLVVVGVIVFLAGLFVLWVDWSDQIAERKVQYQQAAVQQQEAVVQAGVDKVHYDYTLAQVTGEAVAAALLRNQRPPEGPTGAPQRPTAPRPGPPSPMGSSSPTLWVPTYIGPSKALQRRETTVDGIGINDHRGVDPEDL